MATTAATKKTTKPAAPPEPDARRRVNGLLVISDEPVLSPLSTDSKQVLFKGLRRLKLEGGRSVYACAECPEVAGTRGDIIRHQGDKHGRKLARADRKRPEPVVPDEVAQLNVAELIEIARDARRWSEMFEQEQAKTAEWRERAQTAERRVRQFELAMDRLGYVLRDEAA